MTRCKGCWSLQGSRAKGRILGVQLLPWLGHRDGKSCAAQNSPQGLHGVAWRWGGQRLLSNALEVRSPNLGERAMGSMAWGCSKGPFHRELRGANRGVGSNTACNTGLEPGRPNLSWRALGGAGLATLYLPKPAGVFRKC